MSKYIIASLLGISLVLTACQTTTPTGSTTPGTSSSNTTTTPTVTQASTTTANNTSGTETPHFNRSDLTFASYDDFVTFDIDMLLQLWKSEFPTAGITSIELDFADISWFYKISGIDGAKELFLRVNAVDGTVVGREEANDDDDDKVIDLSSIISLKDALDIAEAETSSDTIVKDWELNYDFFGTDTIWYEFDLDNPDLDLAVNARDRSVKK
ncbi:MAG: hypothetical protein GX833_05760 [Clostridium sp.]|jgi:uncharacterized membrane protein YkoI|nr:hypothetical protein [Clostridium sp.]